MRPYVGAGILRGPGDGDYPAVGDVKAAVVFGHGAYTGTYAGEQVEVTVTVTQQTVTVEVT